MTGLLGKPNAELSPEDIEYKRVRHAYYQAVYRCHKPTHPKYHLYGARGIQVCARWQGRDGFTNFLNDMGTRPQNCSLDRIDNNGHYSPQNCRWATRTQQARNTRSNHVLTYQGRSQALAAWAEEFSLPPRILQQRLSRGWNIDRALTERRKRS